MKGHPGFGDTWESSFPEKPWTPSDKQVRTESGTHLQLLSQGDFQNVGSLHA